MSEGLMLVSGTVRELTIYSGEEEFVRSAGQQAAGVAVAAGLATAGIAGAAAGASMAAVSAGDSVEFFSCKVGDIAVEGRFSKASFKDGDDLNIVVEKTTGGLSVLAAVRPKDQTLWILPHYSRGVSSHRKFSIGVAGWVALGLVPVNIFSLWATINGSQEIWKSIIFFGSICFALTCLMSLYFSIRFYHQWLPLAKQAEHIFAALGYPHPSQVDLPRDHKIYCKEHGIKWPYLTDGPWIYRYVGLPHIGNAS